LDDRRFDELSRWVGALALPRLPRRGVMGLLGGATLAGVLGVALEPLPAEAKKCKKEGKKCDKKKCKKKNKKCCCNKLKCKNDRCEEKGPSCPTDPSFAVSRDTFDSPGPDDFDMPFAITTDPDGNVYVTDVDHFRVVAFNQNLNYQDEFGDGPGDGPDEFEEPFGIGYAQNNNGNTRFLYVTDHVQNDEDRKVRQFDGNLADANDFGDFLNDVGVADLNDPYGVAVDDDDRVWVVNHSSPGTVFLFSRGGNLIADFEPSFSSPGDDNLQDPEGIAVYQEDGDTFVFVADTANNRIVKFEQVSENSDGLEYVTEVGNSNGSSGTGNREFNRPTGLAVDDCGNLWVADRFNDRIAVFDKNLDFIDNFDDDQAGTDFLRPTDVALGPDDDALYVVDSDNNRVVKLDLS
jgi:sugar lactone lactonase YvrE